jgi:hypothetical protein
MRRKSLCGWGMTQGACKLHTSEEEDPSMSPNTHQSLSNGNTCARCQSQEYVTMYQPVWFECFVFFPL